MLGDENAGRGRTTFKGRGGGGHTCAHGPKHGFGLKGKVVNAMIDFDLQNSVHHADACVSYAGATVALRLTEPVRFLSKRKRKIC